jgi:hypothetical protein
MSARKRTRVGEEVVDSRSIQQTQDFIEEPARGIGFDPPPARKRTRIEDNGIIAPKRHTLDTLALPARVLLRHVFFLNDDKSRYVSVGFYPARYYQVLSEFGGPRIAPITITEQHVNILAEHLPKLCEAMCRGDATRAKTVYSDYSVLELAMFARMYQDTRFVIFKLDALRYLMNMLHIVQVLQTKYILAQDDVRAYAIGVLRSTEFVELQPTICGLIPYDQLFDELKTPLI